MGTQDTIPWDKVKALSFDIYGTLVDWETGIANSARATALGPYLPTENKELLVTIEKHDTAVQGEHPTMRQSDAIAEGLRRYAAELGVVESGKLEASEVDRACKEYGEKIGEYPAFADTISAMQRLGKRFKLMPLSNIDRKSFDQTLGGPLKGVHFDAIYTAEDIGSYKPDLRNFHYLLDHIKTDFGLEKDQLCHVAQSLGHDHRPAKQMGIQSVWVDRKGFMGEFGRSMDEDFGYQLKVESLGELADIIDKALASK